MLCITILYYSIMLPYYYAALSLCYCILLLSLLNYHFSTMQSSEVFLFLTDWLDESLVLLQLINVRFVLCISVKYAWYWHW